MGESEQAKTAIDYATAHNIALCEALWRIRRQGYTVPEVDHEDAVELARVTPYTATDIERAFFGASESEQRSQGET